MNKGIIFLCCILTSCINQKKATLVKKQTPNILFILVDDLNDYVGVMDTYEMVKTPNIDKLATQATIFNNAHSNAPVCAPSRASLFSGIYPHHSGKFGFKKWEKNEVLVNSKTIMEQLKVGGYKTAGVGKLMHKTLTSAWDEYGLKQDYSPIAFNGLKKTGHPSVPEPFRNLGPFDATFARLSDIPTIEPNEEYSGHDGWYSITYNQTYRYINEQDRDLLPDEKTANWAINKLEEWNNETTTSPFFLGVGLIRPHTPLVVPDSYFDKFPIEEITLPPRLKKGDEEDCFFEKNHLPSQSKGSKHYDALMASYDNEEIALKTYLQAYLASISFMDDQVGKILEKLNQTKFKENTIIVFTSDHGYTLGEKRNLFKNNLWESSTRIPLIIYNPSNKKQQFIDEAVSLIDLYPTICDFANIESDNRKNDKGKTLGGNSLLPLLEGKAAQESHALTVVRQAKTTKLHYSLRTKYWRYIKYADGQEELYDHKNDSYEQNNLAKNKLYESEKLQLDKKLMELIQNGE